MHTIVYSLKDVGASSSSSRNEKGGTTEKDQADATSIEMTSIETSHESQTRSESDAATLNLAMKQMVKVRSRSLKAAHHEAFLRKCLEVGRVPRGLRIHHSEVHLMESPTANKTSAKLTETFRLSELNVCNSLIEHYVQVPKECEMALLQIDETIWDELEKGEREMSSTYEAFLQKLEQSEDSQRSLLLERRQKKLSQLTPHTRSHASLSHT